jgi:Ca2+-binding EF-hand superfamily protein
MSSLSTGHRKRLDELFNPSSRVSSAINTSLSLSGSIRRNSTENTSGVTSTSISADQHRRLSASAAGTTQASADPTSSSFSFSSSSSSAVSSSSLSSTSVKTMSDAYIRSKTKQVTRHSGFLMEQDIDALSAQTGYSRRELYSKFVQFKALATLSESSLGVDRHTFRDHIPALAIEDESFANRVFDLLDVDCTGYLDWEKFLTAMSALDRGSRSLRIEFIFKCADKSGTGVLTRDQLYEFIAKSLRRTALATISNSHSSTHHHHHHHHHHHGGGGGGGDAPAHPVAAATAIPASDVKNEDDLVRDFSYRFFNAVDTKGEGTITLAQTLEYVSQHSEIDDVSSIFGRAMITGTRSELPSLLKESQRLKQEEMAQQLGSTMTRPK